MNCKENKRKKQIQELTDLNHQVETLAKRNIEE